MPHPDDELCVIVVPGPSVSVLFPSTVTKLPPADIFTVRLPVVTVCSKARMHELLKEIVVPDGRLVVPCSPTLAPTVPKSTPPVPTATLLRMLLLFDRKFNVPPVEVIERPEEVPPASRYVPA